MPDNCSNIYSIAIGLQFFLAGLALSSLYLKRSREYPKRPLVIWFFDAAKQGFGAGYVHFLNVGISFLLGVNSVDDDHNGSGGTKTNGPGLAMMGIFGDGSGDTTTDSGSGGSSNPCVWYFLNVLVDTTLGVFILLSFLKLLDMIYHHNGITNMSSGQYGSPPSLRIWLKQTLSFLLGITLTKVVVVAILQWRALRLVELAKWIVDGIQDPRWQVVMVMLIFPLGMNTLQFWLVDSFIRAKSLGSTSGYGSLGGGADGTLRTSALDLDDVEQQQRLMDTVAVTPSGVAVVDDESVNLRVPTPRIRDEIVNG